MIMGDSQTRGMRIVDLCIYVDNNVYKENHDQEKIFNYIYTIIHTLAVKHKFFKNWNYYEGFALEAASRIYQRLVSPKQYLPDDDPKKLKKIKSVLNYIKKTMHPMRVDYQNQIFNQYFDPILHEQTVMDIRDRSYKVCREQSSSLLHIEFEYYLQKLSYTIKKFLQTTPYRGDKVFMNNLYLSCMMTFLNQITLNNYNKKRYKNRLQKGYSTENFLNKVFLTEQEQSTVLFHLPDYLSNYVATLVNQIKHLISKDLTDLIGSFEPSDAIVKSIITSSMGENNNNDSD